MDVVIPGHSVRTFASAIQCLSKIGKDMYLDFDALDGLVLRTLNDSKSAFCHVEFAPSFFERCTTPVTAGRKRSHVSASSQEMRFTCRVPMRALAPVVRPRKGVMTLRIKSEGHNNDEDDDENNKNNDSNASLQLVFEFHLEVMNHSEEAACKPTLCKVLHKMGVAEAENMAAVAPKEDSSELVGAPKVLQKWLEPIKRSAEAAMLFHKDADTVVATSFNTTDNLPAGATKNSLKTETSINLEDLEDYEFQDRRLIPSQPEADPNTGLPPPCPMPHDVNDQVVLVFGMKEAKALLQFCCQNASHNNSVMWDNDHHDEDREPRMPWAVSLNFHWAGRPMIWESKSNKGVSIQLVLATLSHNILKDLPTMQPQQE